MAEQPAAVGAYIRVRRMLLLLSSHPDGLPLSHLAEELGVSAEQLRREVIAYYSTDVPPEALLGLGRPDSIEFLAGDGTEDDPNTAVVLRLSSSTAAEELGVAYLRADQVARLYDAGKALLETEPGNEGLRSALRTLADEFLSGGSVADARDEDGVVARLHEAIATQRRVELVYARIWSPGVSARTVDPYELVRTRRGWELDAGPLQDGRARTYIVDRIISAAILEEQFERPTGLADLLSEERREEPVELVMPHGWHWLVDRFAERSQVVSADRSDAHIRGWFLPPVDERVGLILATAGPRAFVISPESLADSGRFMADRLLRHHGL